MRLREITLPGRDLGAVEQTYRRWGFETAVGADDTVRVEVGHSTLVYRRAERFEGDHHLAFTVPTGSLTQAKAWAAANSTIVGRDGEDEFEAAPSWNARSVYFEGPDGQLLEFIERRRLEGGIEHPFTPADVVGVSEVGVAVADVLETVRMLAARGIRFFGNPPGPEFAAAGDADGMLILVSPGRPWAPAFDRVVADVPVEIGAGVGAPIELAPGKRLT